MRPVVFSASSVNAYLDCHLAWYFGYVLGAEAETSEPQRVGIAVHDYAEHQLHRFRGSPTGMFTTPYLAPTDIEPLAVVFNRDILPTYRDPILIEAAFQIEVNDIPYSGIIDSVDEHDPWGEMPPPMPRRNVPYALILRDLKTTGSRPAAGKYRFAMTGYKLGAEDLLGRPIDAAQLDYIVRTKTPYYWPEAMDPITDDDVMAFAATLEVVAEGVRQAEYSPTGLGTWKCRGCNYAAICGPYQRFKEVNGDG